MELIEARDRSVDLNFDLSPTSDSEDGSGCLESCFHASVTGLTPNSLPHRKHLHSSVSAHHV